MKYEPSFLMYALWKVKELKYKAQIDVTLMGKSDISLDAFVDQNR
jgi:hypothetical protein